jgi:hypothetical protein
MGVGGGAEGKLPGCWSSAESGTSVSSPDSSSSSSHDSATCCFFFFLDDDDAPGVLGCCASMVSLFSVESSSARKNDSRVS